MLEVKNLSVRYGDLTIVNEVSFSLQPGQWLMIVGPNGAGKSTLINAIAQSLPYSGTVHLDQQNLHKIRPGELAKQLGVLMQNHTVSYSFTVKEVVRLGRYAYSRGLFSSAPADDQERVHQALSMTGMLPMADQSVMTLSGGELQRTFLAQLLAQNPRLLFLDEPANHLDLVYQKQVFHLISDWLKEKDRAVVSVVHDLSLAKMYGTHALLMNKGAVQAVGPIAEVLTPENLQETYTMDVHGWMRQMLTQWKE